MFNFIFRLHYYTIKKLKKNFFLSLFIWLFVPSKTQEFRFSKNS